MTALRVTKGGQNATMFKMEHAVMDFHQTCMQFCIHTNICVHWTHTVVIKQYSYYILLVEVCLLY